jgi:formylglycine-generating enzyme
MRLQASWARLAVGSVTVAVCAAACANVLDIQDPKTRNDAGAAGEVAEPNGAGTASDLGGSGNNPIVTGGAGQSGETVLGGAGVGGAAGAGAGGEGGTPTGECTQDEMRCGGDAEKSPEICDETGHWIANSSEADGDCAVACLDGKCAECAVDDPPRCTVCADDAVGCDTNQPQKCVAGVWTNDKTSCPQYCDAGICNATPSCDAANKFRTTCQNSESCCKSLLVPGGSFKRDFDGNDYDNDSFPADVSPFLLDKFEVTVGRVRQFVSAYGQLNLKNGAGKSPHITDDAGWDTTYVLPTDKDALLTELKSCTDATWSDDINTNNDLPLNCVSFNVAYAFCIWDGARLPTEVEWNFAAAGGDEQRTYPWKTPVAGPAITDEYANYGDAALAVGSKPLGDGRWGQSDLAGNLIEWTLDYYGDYPTVCANCLNSTAAARRTQRGGSYFMPEDALVVPFRFNLPPSDLRPTNGFRCARDPK